MEHVSTSAKRRRVDPCTDNKASATVHILRVLHDTLHKMTVTIQKKPVWNDWRLFLAHKDHTEKDVFGFVTVLIQKLNTVVDQFPILSQQLVVIVGKYLLLVVQNIQDIDTSLRLWVRWLDLSNNFLVYPEDTEVFDVEELEQLVALHGPKSTVLRGEYKQRLTNTLIGD